MKERDLVLNAGKSLYKTGLVAGTSGNVSMRLPNGNFLITPSSLSYELMTLDDIVEIDVEGNVLKEGQRPSSEWQMHLEIYKKYSNVNAVVHTHAPYATSFAVNNMEIPEILVEMKPFLGGSVEVAPFAPAGSEKLGKSVLPHLETKKACLMANHGTISIGETMASAYLATEYIEDVAKIYHFSLTVGKPIILN